MNRIIDALLRHDKSTIEKLNGILNYQQIKTGMTMEKMKETFTQLSKSHEIQARYHAEKAKDYKQGADIIRMMIEEQGGDSDA
jgi:lipopolysaccharide biosynthesis regulator YciM